VVQSRELSFDPMGTNDLGNIETGPFQSKLQVRKYFSFFINFNI
jgi:hypothetical protein